MGPLRAEQAARLAAGIEAGTRAAAGSLEADLAVAELRVRLPRGASEAQVAVAVRAAVEAAARKRGRR